MYKDVAVKKLRTTPDAPVWMHIVGAGLTVLAYIIGGSSLVVAGIISWSCGIANYHMAQRLIIGLHQKHNFILAYFIGLLFGLFGLAGYGIFYTIEGWESKPKKR